MSQPREPRVRLFVAVQPDAAAISDVERALAPVRALPAFAGLRWTEPAKLHFTLRFLGSVPLELIPRISDACSAGTSGCTPFELELTGAGAFPSPRRASVLWIGAREGAARLVELAARVNPRLDDLGFEPEARAFTPHLTVARAPKPLPLTAAIDALASIRIPTRVPELLLMRSHLGRPSARYEILARCPL